MTLVATSPATARLGDIASFVRGITFKPDDVVPLGSAGSMAVMRTKNVQAQLDMSDVWAVPSALVKRIDQVLQAGDILVSSANSWNLVGKCCWVPELDYQSSFGGFISVLRAKPDLIHPRYLYHWFSAPRTQALIRSFGQKTTNISNLNIGRAEQMTLPLPTFGEQRRIAELLDKAEELRAKRRAAIALLDQLPQAIFLEMFGNPFQIFENWPSVKLGSVLDYLTSGSRGWAKYYADSGAVFLRIQNVRRDELDLRDVAFVRPPATKEAQRTRVARGDVLLSITADLGRSAVVDERVVEGFINQHLAIMRPTPSLSPRFLSSFIASDAGQAQIQSKNRHGVKAGLNFDDVRSVVIPLPPLDLQREFAARVKTVHRTKAAHQAALEELNILYATLQHRAFSRDGYQIPIARAKL